MGIRVISYFFIVYAFYGYIVKYGVVTNLELFSIQDVCSLVGTEFNYVLDLDDYPAIDPAACTALQGQDLFRIAGLEIIGTAQALKSAEYLAIVDIVNAGTWLIIVVLLEAEIFLQVRHELTGKMLMAGKVVKGFFYSLLFVCAAYWGINGTFLDFWDAFLWLVAFIFIEMNIFQWHEEVEDAAVPEPVKS
jgi:hypothetical protein